MKPVTFSEHNATLMLKAFLHIAENVLRHDCQLNGVDMDDQKVAGIVILVEPTASGSKDVLCGYRYSRE